MPSSGPTNSSAVVATRDGDTGNPLLELLPLVYNLVGRAIGPTPIVFDVLTRVADQFADARGRLSDPDRLRGWLLAATVTALRTAETYPVAVRTGSRDGFAERAVTALGLVDQRREAIDATDWVSGDDRIVLALWWLEVSGRVSRSEVAASIGLTATSAAVVMRRAEAQFEAARTVVRALATTTPCPELLTTSAPANGQPSDRQRHQVLHHIRSCASCLQRTSDLIPADRLIRGFPLVPPSDALVHQMVTTQRTAEPITATTTPPPTEGLRTKVLILVTGLVAAAAITATAILPTGNERPTESIPIVEAAKPAPLPSVSSAPVPRRIELRPPAAGKTKPPTPPKPRKAQARWVAPRSPVVRPTKPAETHRPRAWSRHRESRRGTGNWPRRGGWNERRHGWPRSPGWR